MTIAFEPIYGSICNWAERRGIQIQARQLPPGKAGEFDGLSVTMNSGYDPQEQVYYLVHAIASIVSWSLNRLAVQEMFAELRNAKRKEPAPNLPRLNEAIRRYRAFESAASSLAVWLLAELGHAEVIASYTNFMRADLEAMTEFHQTGRAPVWRKFFARWNEEVADGQRQVKPFGPKPITDFTPLQIEKQEVLQQQAE
jgi:hypothetical protein